MEKKGKKLNEKWDFLVIFCVIILTLTLYHLVNDLGTFLIIMTALGIEKGLDSLRRK